MNEAQYQRMQIVFEPLLELNEELMEVNLFRETPGCLLFLLFRLWAPFMTSYHYLALTNKRAVILPLPRSGYSEYRKHMSVNYGDISVNTSDEQINIYLPSFQRTLHLKFVFFEKQDIKRSFLESLYNIKSNYAY